MGYFLYGKAVTMSSVQVLRKENASTTHFAVIKTSFYAEI